MPTKYGFRELPDKVEQTQARDYLGRLMTGIDSPTQQVAALTEAQRSAIGRIEQTAYQSHEANTQALSYLQGVLSGNYDPRTSQYYQGLRQEAQDLNAQQNLAIRQRSNMSGMISSTPAAGLEAQNTRQNNQALTTQLGGMYENERNRMSQAAAQIGQVSQADMQAQSASYQAQGAIRQYEQAQLDARYNKLINDMQMQYRYGAEIANTLLNEERYYKTNKAKSQSLGSQMGSMAAGAGTAALVAALV